MACTGATLSIFCLFTPRSSYHWGYVCQHISAIFTLLFINKSLTSTYLHLYLSTILDTTFKRSQQCIVRVTNEWCLKQMNDLQRNGKTARSHLYQKHNEEKQAFSVNRRRKRIIISWPCLCGIVVSIFCNFRGL